jgi:hypothetical protein
LRPDLHELTLDGPDPVHQPDDLNEEPLLLAITSGA